MDEQSRKFPEKIISHIRKHWIKELALLFIGLLAGYCVFTAPKEQTLLASLYQEYSQNVKILHDVTYDKQYVNGQMGSYHMELSFNAFDAVQSQGLVQDKSLNKDLQKIYNGIFKVSNSRLMETKRLIKLNSNIYINL